MTKLEIRLTEPVIFLRGDHSSSRRHIPPTNRDGSPGTDEGSAMVRGILTLTLDKPTKVSSIEMDLEGKTTIEWPEGMGARRVEVFEEHKILQAHVVYFNAADEAANYRRRHASVGPGLALSRHNSSEEERHRRREGQDNSHSSDEDSGDESGEERGRSSTRLRQAFDDTPTPSPSSRARNHNRSASMNPYGHYPGEHSAIEAPEILHRTDSGSSATGNNNHAGSSTLQNARDVLRLELEEVTRENTLANATSVSPSRTPDRPGFPTLRSVSASSIPELPYEARDGDRSPSPMGSPTRRSNSNTASPLSSPPTASLLSVVPPPPQINPLSATQSADSGRSLSPQVTREERNGSIGPGTGPGDKIRNTSTSRARFSLPGIHKGMSISGVLKHGLGGGGGSRAEESSASLSPSASRTRRDSSPDRPRENDNETDEEKMRNRGRKRRSWISKALTSAHIQEEKTNGEGGEGGRGCWKEFKKGTYTYPISFALPPTLPPTQHLRHGTLTYKLKASVHRPGAFTSKITATREIELVSCPPDLDDDEADNVIVEREWENSLRYRIELGRKKVEMGGSMEVRIGLVPLEKVKVWRVGLFLEEKVTYLSNFQKPVQHELPTYFEMWNLRGHVVETVDVPGMGQSAVKLKTTEVPLVPLVANNPDTLLNSPLVPYVVRDSLSPVPHSGQQQAEEEHEDGLDALPALFGPGPYHLATRIDVPGCDRIHASFLNAPGRMRGSAEVKHGLKIVLRVEKVGGTEGEKGKDKGKKWDIVIQVGMAVLSCHCSRNWIALPSYSRCDPEEALWQSSCPCRGWKTRFHREVTNVLPSALISRAQSRMRDGGDGDPHHNGAVAGENTDAVRYERLVAGRVNGEDGGPPRYDDVVAR